MGADAVGPQPIAFKQFRGLRNDVSAERFEPTDLELAENCDLDKTGKLYRRDGTTLALAGDVHSLWGDGGATALFVEGTSLKQLAADYTSRTLRTVTAAARMRYQRVDARIYFMNGVECGVFEERTGSVRSGGITPPANPGSAGTGTGRLPEGAYQYSVTFVRSDGQESGAPLAVKLDVPAGGAIVFSQLPVSTDPDVAYKIVYLSAANGETLYRALVLANATTTATYADDGTDLQVPLETQFFEAIPVGHELAVYRGHLLVAVGNRIAYSQPYGYEWFDARDYLPFSSRIAVMAPVDDGVYVATETETVLLAGASPREWEVLEKAPYGALYGSLAYQQPELFGDGSGDGPCALWTATQGGICVGRNKGLFSNLTGARYRADPAAVAAAITRRAARGMHQYVVAMST